MCWSTSAASWPGSAIPAVMLFGIPAAKDPEGAGAAISGGPVARALMALRREVPALSLWADVCLCEYTDHGHCGPLVDRGTGVARDNDATLPRLAAAARGLRAGRAPTWSRRRT